MQLDPDVIEQARQMDLLSYLQRYEPDNLKHVARNVYCTREHDSLKISNQIYCMDCMELMAHIPDNFVSLILTDPPYGIAYQNHFARQPHYLGAEINEAYFKIAQKRIKEVFSNV